MFSLLGFSWINKNTLQVYVIEKKSADKAMRRCRREPCFFLPLIFQANKPGILPSLFPLIRLCLGQFLTLHFPLPESLLWPHLMQTFPGLRLFNAVVERISHLRDGLFPCFLLASPLAFKLLEGTDEPGWLTILPPGRSTGTWWVWRPPSICRVLSTLGDHRIEAQWVFLLSDHSILSQRLKKDHLNISCLSFPQTPAFTRVKGCGRPVGPPNFHLPEERT